MKKVIKSRIFLVIITMIICISGTLYASTTYKASDVVYNASDGTSMSVNDALNDLYNKGGNKGYYYYYANGTAIYYNPVSGEICTDYVDSNSINENKTGCMKWYIFNDSSESATVNMILDHNTTATLVWNSSNKNVAYDESNIKPEVDKLVSESKWIDIPRLISAEEIAQITEKMNFVTSNISTKYFLDSNNSTQSAKSQGASRYAWLYDYTNGCTSYGCNIADSSNYGYWTSTTVGVAGAGSTIWYVVRGGDISYHYANYSSLGIRPVITISKSKLS